MDEKQIMKLIEEYVVNGELSCGDAHKISEANGIALPLIGRICNESDVKIKITKCLLGCF